MNINQLGSEKKYNIDELAKINDQKTIFDTFENPHPDMDYIITSTMDEFTAVCPVTGQPDFAAITIETKPDKKCIELKSLKMYLMSFRNKGIFHEAVTGKIAKDIISVIDPKWIRVTGNFKTRGGISTKVVFENPSPENTFS